MRLEGWNLDMGLAMAMAIIGLSTWGNPQAQAQLAQSAPAHTIFEDVTLGPNFSPDPTTVRGISGGPQLASDAAGRMETATGPCAGYVDVEPDHTMVLTEFFDYLSLQIQSPADTTLVVRGPGGSWCNDDYTDQNPGIAGQWFSGTYHIWIGSYEVDSYHPYVIRISASREP
jgi:hypothetical protein